MAQYEDFSIDRGADASLELHLEDINGAHKNLSAYSVQAKLKKTYNSDSASTTDFTSIVSDSLNGVVTLSLTNAQTGNLKPGRYVYDIELSHQDSAANTIIERILEGTITVTPSVTR